MITKDRFSAEAEVLSPALRRIALSLLYSVPDAEDAVQQALLKAWEKRLEVDETRFKAYITRIAVNECHNIQRARMRVTPTDSIPESAYVPPDTGLQEAIDALPEALRLPLLLKYMEGYSEREIVKALSLSLPQLKSRLFRARGKLRVLISEVNGR